MSNFSLDPSLYDGDTDTKPAQYPETYPQMTDQHLQQQQQQQRHHVQQQQQQTLPQLSQLAQYTQHTQHTPQAAPMGSAVPPPPPPASDGGAVPQQSDVDDFLRKKRKAREHKACYPCRQRKVKCDLSRPCQTCRDREHPELCSYHPPNKRQNGEQSLPANLIKLDDATAGAASGTGNVTLSRGEFEMICRKLNTLETSLAELRQEVWRNAQGRANENHDPTLAALANGAREVSSDGNSDGMQQFRRHTEIHGIHTTNEAGTTVHFGAASIPAVLAAMRDGTADQKEIYEVFGKSILPMFGLDNESATYPFVDLWGLPHGSLARAQELAKALPNDEQMFALFQYYRDLAHVIYPGVVSLDLMEQELNEFIISRGTHSNQPEAVSENSVFGKNFHWIGLLFAVLASGAQTCQMPRKERELTSQVYMCCAMECLRFVNFLSQANLETLQTLLVIQNVLTNNMNAGIAWSLHGLTIRLAQGLGLHHPCPPSIPYETVYPRSRIWWAIVWQDSLLSIIYDRASEPTTANKTTMPMPMKYGPVSAYHTAMYSLVKVGLDIVRDRGRVNEMKTAEVHSQIAHHRDSISCVMRESAEYLRDSRKCTSPQETLEHWALYLHTSYSLSELSRAAISPRADKSLVESYRELCVDNLINTVEAYLGLNGITSYARHSWAAIHRGLGSALLLGILGEHNKSERARLLLARFISAIYEITTNIDPQEIAAPLQRGMSALRRLNIHEASGSHFHEASPNDGLALDDDGSLKLDQNNIFTPPNSIPDLTMVKDEHSPYSVLNTILWGATDAQGNVIQPS